MFRIEFESLTLLRTTDGVEEDVSGGGCRSLGALCSLIAALADRGELTWAEADALIAEALEDGEADTRSPRRHRVEP